jgi:hypothetical protein
VWCTSTRWIGCAVAGNGGGTSGAGIVVAVTTGCADTTSAATSAGWGVPGIGLCSACCTPNVRSIGGPGTSTGSAAEGWIGA